MHSFYGYNVSEVYVKTYNNCQTEFEDYYPELPPMTLLGLQPYGSSLYSYTITLPTNIIDLTHCNSFQFIGNNLFNQRFCAYDVINESTLKLFFIKYPSDFDQSRPTPPPQINDNDDDDDPKLILDPISFKLILYR